MEKTTSSRSSKLDLFIITTSVIAILVTIIVLLLYFTHFPATFSGNQGEWGQFGDYVGGVLNPLFSVFGFFALLYTIRQQSEVIELQAYEMATSNVQLKNSADALMKQNEYYERQQFDAKLFHLMSLHSETLATTKIVHTTINNDETGEWLDADEFSGSQAIHVAFHELLDESFASVRRGENFRTIADMEKAYADWFSIYGAPLSRYFGSIKNIVRFISNSPFDENVFSIELLRSQIGDEEQRLLVYVCALDENMRSALGFLNKNKFGGKWADKDSFSEDLTQLVSYRLYDSFI